MIIKEYRITMPMTAEEYQVGQLFSVAETSRTTTNGHEGIEVVKNEPFENVPLLGDFTSGQYTYKIYHFASKVPGFVRRMLPNNSMAINEEAWNAYPYCKTVLSSSVISKETFCISIESIHLNDQGDTENAHQLSPELLKAREVIYIDIANDPMEADTLQAQDPKQFRSTKTGRGPLAKDWKTTTTPLMTCYKLVRVKFHMFGLQTRVESWVQSSERRLFLQFNRQIFCSIDKWHGMTLDDIRKMEELVQEELKKSFQPKAIE